MNKTKKIFILFLFLVFLLFNFSLSARAQDEIKCSICSIEITGTYWKADDGKIICDKCYKSLPRCGFCDLPVKDYQYVSGKICCTKCLEKFSRCSLCGKPSLKTWKMISRYTGRTNLYCDGCFNTAKKCSICGLLVSPSVVPLPDGRYICMVCTQDVVRDKYQIMALYRHVQDLMKSMLRMKIKNAPELIVVDLREFKKVHSKSMEDKITDELGLYTCKRVTYEKWFKEIVEIKEPKIYILNFLPYKTLLWVLAHELAHAWIEENKTRNLALVLNEGFADWVAYSIIAPMGDNIMLNYLKERQDIYGRGLRFFLEIERKSGAKAVFDYLGVKRD